MTKSATRVAADKVTFTQAEVTSAVALKAPIAAPVFTGNVGVGVTPETSGSNYNVLQIGQGGSLMAPTATEDMYVGSNVYRNSSNTNSYIVTEKASIYEQYNGEHYFNVAPSGSADAAISFAQGMKSSNAGIVTMPYQPAFSAYRNAGHVTSGVLVCNGEHFDTGGNHNTSNGRFTAPVAGKYMISTFHMCVNNAGTLDNKYYSVNVNGSIYKEVYNSSGGAVHHQFNWSGLIQLAANDYVTLNFGNFNIYAHHANYSTFSGHLIG